ncbi:MULTISPECIES: HU family DNA-binding protein [unclassified Nocardioides]|uniref:HU family DNA-binding protein n=1 Tax=unclassified Nocardioides TaxID=2615069 RepID=UPI0026670B82|nr:HU family DNA-binding protein [Nocardioides sp. Arc9.136]WKN50719.1 HU family DNA-binding protein [Nocardioides sp. Arc9.136]
MTTNRSSTMNKGQLRDAVAEQTGLGNKEAEQALDAVIDSIVKAVASGDKVSISGFGTFESRERSARQGRNPQTGETIEIAATTAPAFKAASAFKQAVSGS